jgi:hypothetical protein
MRLVSREEEGDCRVVMTNVFPGTDLVVVSQVFNRDQFGESVIVQGSNESITVLHPHLRSLLSKGDDLYLWSGVHRNPTSPPEISLQLEETGERHIPRVELVGYMFRRDVVDYCDLLISPLAFIEVVSPWGSFIKKQVIGLPSGRDGTIPIGSFL